MSSHRITVRLNEQLHNLLKKTCDDSGHDLTTVVRKALESVLNSGEDSRQEDGNEIVTVPPEDIYEKVGRYLAWGRGDLRVELKKQYIEILATAFAAQRHFPRTPGIKEAYAGLLQISAHIKFN